MRIWSILLIKSDLKCCIHLSTSLVLNFNNICLTCKFVFLESCVIYVLHILITSYMYTHQLFSDNDKSNYLVNVLDLSKTCCNFIKITYNVTHNTNKVQTKGQ